MCNQKKNKERKKLRRKLYTIFHSNCTWNFDSQQLFLVILKCSEWRSLKCETTNKIRENEKTIIFQTSQRRFWLKRLRFISDSFYFFRFAKLSISFLLVFSLDSRHPHPSIHRLVSLMLLLYQHDLSHHVISLLNYVVATNVNWLSAFSSLLFFSMDIKYRFVKEKIISSTHWISISFLS